MMQLYNTMTRRKQEFEPMHGRKVLMYTCGLTVYDYAHIGNMRSFLFEDLLRRVLASNDYEVKHVQNFTDVGHLVSDEDTGDDKMELSAKKERKSAWEIAEHYIHAFKADFSQLRMLEPTVWCRATDNVEEMINLVQRLEKNGYTYIIEDGVYFDTSKLKDYGKLAKLNVKGLRAGARVEMVEGKKNPTDFALWKFSLGRKRDMEWDSPWGRGFPGWHIECSAMAMKYLAETIDVHCGGVDHITVHHTNEIAQSEGATGKTFSHFWLHNEFMLVDGKKMSKSLGNFYTLKDLKERGFPPLAFRYLCLSVHYRSQMNFTFTALEDAQKTLRTINDFVHRVKTTHTKDGRTKKIDDAIEKAEKDFTESINDDLNMPDALASLFDFIKSVNKELDAGHAGEQSIEDVKKFLAKINDILDVFEHSDKTLTAEEKKLLELRERFRREKDFAAADEIRDQLKEKGIIIEDGPHGVKWKKI